MQIDVLEEEREKGLQDTRNLITNKRSNPSCIILKVPSEMENENFIWIENPLFSRGESNA
jgi:hypothetical protein